MRVRSAGTSAAAGGPIARGAPGGSPACQVHGLSAHRSHEAVVALVVAAASVAATVVLVALFDRPSTAVGDAAGAGAIAGVATVAVASSVSRAVRRSSGGAPPAWAWPAAVAAGMVLGVVAALGLADPSVTTFGLPTPAAVPALRHALSRTLFVSVHGSVPVAPTTALVLATALGAVVVAVAGQALWYATGRILAALAPGALAVVGCGWVARGDGAVPLVLAWAVVAFAAVLASGGRRQPLLAMGMVVASVGIGATMAVVPVSGSRLFPTAPGTARSGSVLVVRHPSADVLPEKITLSHVEVMTVRSRLPSYWQLTTLNRFTGTQWVPGTPARPPASARRALHGVTEVLQQVHLLALDSAWLPAAPEPQSVHGAPGAVVEAADGGVVDRADPSRYSVVSAVPSEPASKLAALPAVAHQRWLAPDLSLAKVPAVVTRLAHRLVAGVSGPYRQALALVQFFDSGRFRYTLSPPAGPAGVDPLVAFLTDTRAGYCQQFASAFAVLARIDGLPTRLGVGFATGNRIGPGVYEVLGTDAHVWPEVYLGASVGWVAFEPTPAASASAAPAGGVHQLLPRSAARSSARPVGVQGLGGVVTGIAALPARSAIRPANRALALPASPAPARHPAGGGPWVVAGPGLAGVVFAVVIWLALRRRRRRGPIPPAASGEPEGSARRGGRRWWAVGVVGAAVGLASRRWHRLPVMLARRWPDTAEQRVEASWASVTRTLRRRHGPPMPHETAVGYVARVSGGGTRERVVEGRLGQPGARRAGIASGGPSARVGVAGAPVDRRRARAGRRGTEEHGGTKQPPTTEPEAVTDPDVVAELAALVNASRFGSSGSDEVSATAAEALASRIDGRRRRGRELLRR